MREKMVCRFCGIQSGITASSNGRRPFAITGATSHYAPDRPFRLEHILLDLRVDPRAKTLSGVVTQKVRVIAPEQKLLSLDQIGLQIEAVTIEKKSVEFSIYGHSLNIHLGFIPSPGDLLEVSVQYQVASPQRGVYFTGPDVEHPAKPYQVWTQGQDEDSRYWFPTLDYPSQKSTSEVIAVVPHGFVAVSNGALVSKEEVPQGIRYHYRLGMPHVTYLITLVVAELVEWSDRGPAPRELPIQYYVPLGREEDGRRAFQNTPKMIEVFEKKTGVPYPFEKYSQVAVQDFIFGGMENTSATTQTDLTLHDSRAHLDFSSDPLVSHELAHQWFGDLVTCRDWSHGWLNEGFATFMERIWVEENTNTVGGFPGGFEEAKYYSYQDLKEYLADDQGRYRRPIVCNTYIEPIDLFDTHLYQKGGLVLNLIRHVLGDVPFWKSIQAYLNQHRGKNVETLDLIRSIEETTGRNLRQFADEWLFSAGHPEFEVTYQWHEEKKLNEWVIQQKQTGGLPFVTQDGVTTVLFHLPVLLEMTLRDGSKVSQSVQVGEARERIFISSSAKPTRVRLDPDHWIPKTMKFPRPKEMLLCQLVEDPDCMGRIEAAQELVKVADAEIVAALGQAAASDSFWGVQVEAAQALAELRTNAARDALIRALNAQHPQARRAIVAALGTYSLPSEVLRKVAERDESYFVEAEATHAWVRSQLRPTGSLAGGIPEDNQAQVSSIEKFLLNQLSKSSYRDVIGIGAIRGLAELPGIGVGERPQAFQVLIDRAIRREFSLDLRGGAVRALGRILKTARVPERKQILDVLNQAADEDNFRLRSHLVATLDESGCSEATPILAKILQLDSDGRIKRSARVALDRLTTAGTTPESIQSLKAALLKLEEDYRKLEGVVAESVVRSKTV